MAAIAEALSGGALAIPIGPPGPFDLVVPDADAEKNDHPALPPGVVARLRPDGVVLGDTVAALDAWSFQSPRGRAQ